jgi:L-ascorbate metabolism protein UlaG (beta-lactamase superfamily)
MWISTQLLSTTCATLQYPVDSRVTGEFSKGSAFRVVDGQGLWSRRLTEPAVAPADLPQLDAVLLSHLHGDHFDRVARRELNRSQPVITTPHAAHTLRRCGFDADCVEEWDCRVLAREGETLTVTALPAVHARGLLGRLLPPAMGTMLEHTHDGQVRRRVYLSGDTLTGDHLDEIARRHPDIDLAVMHLGGTRVLFHTVTMDGDQGVDALERIVHRALTERPRRGRGAHTGHVLSRLIEGQPYHRMGRGGFHAPDAGRGPHAS